MYLDSIHIKNFRNYGNTFINFSKNINIIYGENAQGKTNIIEAVFLCASGRSHRTNKDYELIKHNSDGYKLEIEVVKKYDKINIEMEYGVGRKKSIKINEIPIKKIGNLMGNLIAVIFSPEDILLIKEGPSQRRRFIDITVSQIKPAYFYDLQEYAKILMQRNALLKEIQKDRGLIDTLDVWDRKISQVASKIMKTRDEFITVLSEKTSIMHKKLTNGKEELNIKYSPSNKIKTKNTTKEIEEELERELKKNRNMELKRCITLIGPHRDEYEIILNGMNLKIYGSQGQQRTSVLSIKLSEIEIIKEEIGEYPVLLLDDVLSELDENRKKYLYMNLGEMQTFITCTKKDFFERENNGDNKYIKVINGSVEITE